MSEFLLKRGERVIGIDMVNDYYDPEIKWKTVEILKQHANFQFFQIDISRNREKFEEVLKTNPDHKVMIHLAARVRCVETWIEGGQAGVFGSVGDFSVS